MGGGVSTVFFPFFSLSFLFFFLRALEDAGQADRSQPPVGLSASGSIHGHDWLQNQTHTHRRTGRTSHARTSQEKSSTTGSLASPDTLGENDGGGV